MLYECENCGAVMTEDELATYQECVGEFWGSPAYETFDCCPHCGGEVYEYEGDEEDEECKYYDDLLEEMHREAFLDYREDEE